MVAVNLTFSGPELLVSLQDIMCPCIFGMNAFLRYSASFSQNFRTLHRDTAASIAMAIGAACYYLRRMHAGADAADRADLVANAWDVFDLVEVNC